MVEKVVIKVKAGADSSTVAGAIASVMAHVNNEGNGPAAMRDAAIAKARELGITNSVEQAAAVVEARDLLERETTESPIKVAKYLR